MNECSTALSAHLFTIVSVERRRAVRLLGLMDVIVANAWLNWGQGLFTQFVLWRRVRGVKRGKCDVFAGECEATCRC